MPTISLYVDIHGNVPVKKFIQQLKSTPSKDTDSQRKQINYKIKLLEKFGTWGIGTDVAKRICGDIWELRPGKNRILFFVEENSYVLLHVFRKTTAKTPKTEIEKAKKEIMYLKTTLKNE